MDNELYESLVDIVTFLNQPLRLGDQGVLDGPSLLLILQVERHPQISVGQLARRLGRNHSSVSRLVDKLMATGWLIETDRRDQRVRRVMLSPAGRRGWLQFKLTREAQLQEKLTGYSVADRAELRRVLHRLATTLWAVDYDDHHKV